jgi:HSP20 family protein
MVKGVCPFLEPDRWVSQVFGQNGGPGHATSAPALDAYRDGEHYVLEFDLPGVVPSSVEATVEGSVLTIRARRHHGVADGAEVVVAERPSGAWTRELTLGEALDTDHIEADYTDGVLRLRFGLRAHEQPRRIEIAAGRGRQSTG